MADKKKMTKKKAAKENTSKARTVLRNPVESRNIPELLENLSTYYADTLERYPD
jgi:hypothetical protein